MNILYDMGVRKLSDFFLFWKWTNPLTLAWSNVNDFRVLNMSDHAPEVNIFSFIAFNYFR